MSYASQKQLKQVVEKIENKKASKTGIYPELVAGNLVNTKADPTSRVFSFDSSCGNASISGDGYATIKTIKGNTNVFNQIVKDSEYVDEVCDGVVSMDVPEHTISQRPSALKTLGGHIEKDDTLTSRAGVLGNTRKWNQLIDLSKGEVTGVGGLTFVRNTNGSVRFYGTTNTERVYKNFAYSELKGKDHKELFILNIIEGTFPFDRSTDTGFREGYSNFDLGGIFEKTGAKIISRQSPVVAVQMFIGNSGVTVDCTFYAMVVDLTDIFGVGNEPTDVNDVRVQQLIEYAKAHPEYDEGSLKNVELEELEYCGENIWDEEWENGTFDTSTGANISNNQVRSKNPISVFPNTEYYFNTSLDIWVMFLDINMQPIPLTVPSGYSLVGNSVRLGNTDNRQLFTTPNNSVYCKFYCQSGYGTTYKNDICINVSNDAVNGTYLPYSGKKIVFSQPISLNGLETSQDEIYSYVEGNELVTKKVQRYGTHTFTGDERIGDWQNGVFFVENFATDFGAKIPTTGSQVANMLSNYLVTTTMNNAKLIDGSVSMYGQHNLYGGWLFLYLSTITTVNEWKEYLKTNTLTIIYELATPIITEISRVPLTCDFTHVENVLTNNTSPAQEIPNIEKGVIVTSMTEKVDITGENLFPGWNAKYHFGGTVAKGYFLVSDDIEKCSIINVEGIDNITFGNEWAYGDNNIRYLLTNEIKENGSTIYSNAPTTSEIPITIDTKGAKYLVFAIGNGSVTVKSDFMVNRGNILKPYKPYFHRSYLETKLSQIKERVGDIALGYIDFAKKKFVKNMEKVDLGTLNWTYYADYNGFYTETDYIKPVAFYAIANILAAGFTTVSDNSFNNNIDIDKIICRNSTNYLKIRVIGLDASNINAYLSGVILNYELATTVETDLSDILTEADAEIMVEAGGTVEFTAKTNINIGWNKDQYTIPLITSNKYLHKDRANGTNDIKTGISSLVVNSADNATGDNLINLTHMFGSGKEPATFDELCRIYPKFRGDVPYSEGKMVNYKGTSIRTVGFNQWDEEWESGGINQQGQPEIATNRIRAKNFIKVLPNTTYYSKPDINTREIHKYFYDENLNFISGIFRSNNNLFTTPTNCYYMKITIWNMTTYNNNICLNLVWSGYRNGEYEPHWNNTLDLSNVARIQNHTIKCYIRSGSVKLSKEWLSLTADGEALTPVTNKAYKIVSQGDYLNKVYFWNGTVYEEDTTGKNLLFPDGLLSAGNVHDEVFADHAIKRVGVVDLGMLNWSLKIANNRHIFTCNLSNLKKSERADIPINAICPLYNTVKTDDTWVDKDMAYEYSSNSSSIAFVNNSYNDVISFKSAMSGIILNYELANPITVTFDDNDETGSANQLAPLNMSYKVSDFGTEESLPENDNVIPEFAPLVADIIYSSDFTRQLATMNKNYVSVESLDNLITIISAATGTTIEKVWDSENSKWNFVIR